MLLFPQAEAHLYIHVKYYQKLNQTPHLGIEVALCDTFNLRIMKHL